MAGFAHGLPLSRIYARFPAQGPVCIYIPACIAGQYMRQVAGRVAAHALGYNLVRARACVCVCVCVCVVAGRVAAHL